HSDQFSLGSIIFEMATGRRPFRRDTVVQTMAAIIDESSAELTSLNVSVPERLQNVVSRCFQKDPQHRYVSTRDLTAELREVSIELGGSGFSKVALSTGFNKRRALRMDLVIVLIAIGLLTALVFVPAVRQTLRTLWSFGPLPGSKNIVVLPF